METIARFTIPVAGKTTVSSPFRVLLTGDSIPDFRSNPYQPDGKRSKEFADWLFAGCSRRPPKALSPLRIRRTADAEIPARYWIDAGATEMAELTSAMTALFRELARRDEPFPKFAETWSVAMADKAVRLADLDEAALRAHEGMLLTPLYGRIRQACRSKRSNKSAIWEMLSRIETLPLIIETVPAPISPDANHPTEVERAGPFHVRISFLVDGVEEMGRRA